jgi:aspartate racemase
VIGLARFGAAAGKLREALARVLVKARSQSAAPLASSGIVRWSRLCLCWNPRERVETIRRVLPQLSGEVAAFRRSECVHIGLIGGIGPAATEFYYRGLIDRHAASETPLDLTIAHADVTEMVRNLASRDAKEQAEVFAKLLRRLRAAGAEIAAVTSMGGHFCIRELEAISPIPLLNALPVVDAAITERAYKTVGIIGTRMVMGTRLYGAISSAAVIAPEGDEFEEVQANYGAMATVGRVTDSQRRIFFRAGRRLVDRGAEAVLLGGTDLLLAFQGQDCRFPVLDLANVHIDAIYRRSVNRS